jgi:predicted cupin superfamily sugar epimerase
MHPRAVELIASLGLLPHPEGGYFREIHRSAAVVSPADGRPGRSSLTVIYFLLPGGDVSRWHRVASEEAWHFIEGRTIDLLVMDDRFDNVSTKQLGPWAPDVEPVHVVPVGAWQAARCAEEYALVSCTVAPGFDFADFEMLRDRVDDAAAFRRTHPDLTAFV